MEEIGIISAVERQKKNKSRVSVFVDGGYLGSVEDIVWARSGLKSGDVLKAEVWEDMRTRQEEQAALDRAMKRLSTRARGRVEMEQYLLEKGFSAEAVAAAIEKLQGYGYINDEEYAAMYVRDRMSLKPMGRRNMAGELKRLGIEAEDAAQALEQYSPEDELEAVLKEAEKALRRTTGESDFRKRKAKAFASLARRGFSADLINQALSRLLNGSEDD